MAGAKHSFWQALIFTIIVFAIGILLGFFLEGSRADSIELTLLNSEISLLDEQVRLKGVDLFDVDCGMAKDSVFLFADNIYDEVRQLERYDANAKLDDTLKVLHRRYDLLRMLLWMEGIDLKNSCGGEVHTVVYVFDYASDNVEVKARQASLSRLLLDLKNENGDKVLLIPIAGNLNLGSIDLALERFGIEELPVIIVDEDKIVSDTVALSELEGIVFEEDGFRDLEGIVFKSVDFSENEKIILNANKQ